MLLKSKLKVRFLRGFGREKIKNNGLYLHATFTSHKTLHTIYFPNCRRTLRSYFFARKLMKFINEKSCVIMENWNQTLWKTFKDNSQPKKFRKTETKLCGNLQRQFSDFSNLKTIFSPKLCGKLKTEPNFVDKRCVEFFSSWKYNTVCNIGLFRVASFVIFLTRRC